MWLDQMWLTGTPTQQQVSAARALNATYGGLGEIEIVGLGNLGITYTKLVTKLLTIVYFSTLIRT